MTIRMRYVQICAWWLVCLAGASAETTTATAWQPVKIDTSAAEKLGWRVAIQSYSFKGFTLFEAIDKTASIGVKHIEVFPGQTVSKDRPDVKAGYTMPKEIREEIKKKLLEAGVKWVNYGVITVKGEEKWRQLFDFAKDVGLETIVSEPAAEDFDLLDKLTEEYKINISIHNHPEPSKYWNPDTLLEAIKGHSKRIGSCADTGHWMRSGVNPLDALKKLEGRIVSLHFKDLDEFGTKKAHDVPWGEGKGDVKAMLAELRRQKFQGVFSIEYEYNMKTSLPEIARCVENFNRIASGS